METVRREIEAINDLQTAKSAALLLLQQVQVQRDIADVLINLDWTSRPAA